METELGKATHHYWWECEQYFRQSLSGGSAQVWQDSTWKDCNYSVVSIYRQHNRQLRLAA